jgi:Ca-activated chloride channel homolog
VPVDRAEMARIAKISGGGHTPRSRRESSKTSTGNIGSSVGKQEVDREVTSRNAGFGLGFAILASLGLISLGARWP